MTDPLEEIANGLKKIGSTLAENASLTSKEKSDVVEWTKQMAIAFAVGDSNKVENYRVSLNNMLGVVELRAAQSAERAAIAMGNLALDTLIKVGIALL